MEELKEMHHLQDTPITVVYPWLKYINCLSCCKKKEKVDGIEEPLLPKEKKLKLKTKINIKSDEVDKDPLMKLGYGIVAYRNILWVLICAFIVFTILALPSMVLYSRGSGY